VYHQKKISNFLYKEPIKTLSMLVLIRESLFTIY